MADIFSTISAVALEHCYLIGLASIGTYYVLNRETRNFPPGPTGLPIVGYIPFLGTHTAQEELAQLSSKYGPVFSIKLGPNNCVIVNDYKSAIELMNNEAAQDRPSPSLFTLFVGSDDSLLSWKGQLWKEHRKFILRALRTVGVGKPEIEHLIEGEISYMLDQIAKDGQDGARSVLVTKYLTPSTSNVVNAVITGKRFDYDHPVRIKQDAAFSNSSQPAVPWTGYIANFCKLLLPLRNIAVRISKQLAKTEDGAVKFIIAEVEEQKKTFKDDGDANIISAYLSEYDSKKADDTNTLLDRELNANLRKLSYHNTEPAASRIPGLAGNLLGAGSATVKDAMEWAYLFCALYPDIQDKLIKEMEDVIGYDRKPCYADRTNMPYTQAFLWESMRHSSAIPINLPHVASSDIEIGGHTIPNGYHIYLNFWAIHHDPKYWKDPEKFEVERFLTPEGNKLVKHEAFMPFSTGRRSCPGEPLAQVELFVYLVMTLQRYKIQPPEGVTLSLDGGFSAFSFVPKKLELLFLKRK